MSMLLSAAETYVLRAGGFQADDTLTTQVDQSLAAAAEWMDNAHLWSWLLTETYITLGASPLSAALTSSGTTATVDSTVGMVAGCTLLCEAEVMTLSSVGSSTSLTLATRGTVATPVGGTVGAAHAIGAVVARRDYSSPSNFHAPYGARLVRTDRTLTYRDQREVDRTWSTSIGTGVPDEYTIYTPGDFDPTTLVQGLRLSCAPAAQDSLVLRYYRRIAPGGVTVSASVYIDVHDRVLYILLDYATQHLLRRMSPADPRIGPLYGECSRRLEQAVGHDLRGIEEDHNTRFLSEMEVGTRTNRPAGVWGW